MTQNFKENFSRSELKRAALAITQSKQCEGWKGHASRKTAHNIWPSFLFRCFDLYSCVLFLSDPPPCLPLSLACFTWLIGLLILKANGERGGGSIGLKYQHPALFWMDGYYSMMVSRWSSRAYWSAQNSSILVEMLKQKFGQNFEAEVWPILWSWILIILWYNSKVAS